MPQPVPIVIVLHGEDEYAIAQFVSKEEEALGDGASGGMNISRLDGRTYPFSDLPSLTQAMPFLARRRLVVYSNFLAGLNNPASREKFKAILEKVPETTELILIENKPLVDERDRKKGKQHWIEKWAEEQPGTAVVKEFAIPKGGMMARWIQEKAKSAGGQISPGAAALLSNLAGEDARQVNQEIQKLLAYVDWKRPVEPEDVEALTADSRPGDIFGMVDALGSRDGRKAMAMLSKLLETEDPFSIFGMVIRQFRLLLQAREILDARGSVQEVARAMGIHPYVAEKIIPQARRFSLPVLEAIYHRLLDLDEQIKTGQIPPALALETLVAAFS